MPGITVEMSYSRSETGSVTYKSVYLDGVQSILNATAPSAYAADGSDVIDQLPGGWAGCKRLLHGVPG